MQVEDAFVSLRPVARALAVLLLVGAGLLDRGRRLACCVAQVHDDRDVLLPHELPEVGHSVRKRPLAHDIERLPRVMIMLQATLYMLVITRVYTVIGSLIIFIIIISFYN